MGIQDRDYYRNDGPSIFDALMPQGVVCRWLIGINVAVFVMQMAAYSLAPTEINEFGQRSYGWVTDWFILDTKDVVLHGQVWRVLTFAFLHSPDFLPLHLLFNMLFLWWFGSDVEQLYGRREFLAIYLCSALAGGVTYVLWAWARGVDNRCLGASGAVTTLLILCALHFPRRIIYIYFLPMPIWVFALINVAQDSFGMFNDMFGGVLRSNVAFVVHLAGAVFAVAYYKMQWRITGRFRELLWWRRPSRSRTRLKLFDPEPDVKEPVAVSANATPPAVVDEHLEAKLDAVLEKIAKSGQDSLTQQEQEILKQAAEMYKKRRS